MNKLSALREKMEQNGFDAILVTSEINQRYLSGFHFSDGLIIAFLNKAFLLTDFRYYEAATAKSDPDFEVVMPESKFEFIDKVFVEYRVKNVGFEGDSLSYQQYVAYSKRFNYVNFMPIGDTFSRMRSIKDADEIEKIKRAQEITDAAFEALLKGLTSKMTEREVALELDYLMRKQGADDVAFETIAVSGDASAIPHGTARDVRLKRGFLTMDFGAKFDGYCADMTRTVIIGKADAEIKKLYNTVLLAQKSALEYLREGADAGEADKIARDIIDSIPEYRGAFGHSLGHSVGLEVHESPNLSRRSFGCKLQSGVITSVEPGIYLTGKYGCRIEDLVLIEKGGIFNFTHSSKELIEIY